MILPYYPVQTFWVLQCSSSRGNFHAHTSNLSLNLDLRQRRRRERRQEEEENRTAKKNNNYIFMLRWRFKNSWRGTAVPLREGMKSKGWNIQRSLPWMQSFIHCKNKHFAGNVSRPEGKHHRSSGLKEGTDADFSSCSTQRVSKYIISPQTFLLIMSL